jgi:hypothetical protein
MKALTIAACGCFVIAACSNNNKLPVETQNAPNSMSSGEALLSDLVLGQQSHISRNGEIVHKTIDVHLWNPDSMNSVSGGTIYINNQAIPRLTVQGNTWYQNTDNSYNVPLSLDGTYHVFNVSGAPGYPAFVDSLRSPASPTVITYPAATDTLSKSTGVTITWSPTSSVDALRVVIQDTSRSVGSKAIVKDLPGNSGSVTITPADMSNLKLGRIRVSVFRGNNTNGTVSSGQKYRLVVYSSQEVATWLKM